MKNLNCENCLWTCKCDGDCCEMTFLSDEYFENVVLPKLREENEVRAEMWMEEDYEDCCSINYYQTATTNDNLREIRSGMTVYLYNLREVIEILSFEPDVQVILNDGIYYANK